MSEAVQKQSGDGLGKLGLILYPLPLIVFLVVWHVLTNDSPDRQFTFSSPKLVIEAFVKLASSGELLKNTMVTVLEAVSGFLMGTITGATVGLSFWYSRTIAKIANPYITALATIPIFSLAPVIITWFGIGLWSKIMLAFLSTVAVAIVQSYQGAMSVEPRFLKFMHVAGASRPQIFRMVVMPSALIWVINAMRLNIGLALLGAFIGEFISAEEGLGYMINKASGLYDMATVFVGVIALIFVALALTAIIDQLERRLLKWRKT